MQYLIHIYTAAELELSRTYQMYYYTPTAQPISILYDLTTLTNDELAQCIAHAHYIEIISLDSRY